MLDPLVLAALVELIYVIAQTYFPQFPISKEFINAVILILLGLFTFRAGVKPLARKLWPQLEERGLLSKE